MTLTLVASSVPASCTAPASYTVSSDEPTFAAGGGALAHRAAGEEGELHPARSDQESARFAAAGEAPCPPAGPSLRAPWRAAAVSRIRVCESEPRTRRSAATALRGVER